jgi:hypothetical protein
MEFEDAAVLGWGPDLCHLDEGLHGVASELRVVLSKRGSCRSPTKWLQAPTKRPT